MRRIACCLYSILCLFMLHTEASHYAGSTLTAGYAGSGNDYYIKFVFYRDCQGISPASDAVVFLEQNGMVKDTVVLPLLSVTDHTDSLCGLSIGNCQSHTGVEGYTYIDTISLSVPGNYRLWTTGCCYGLSMPFTDYHVEAILHVDNSLNDRLPDFISDPKFNFCLNSWNIYNSLAVDADGDSLVYSLIPATLFDTATNTVQPFPYGPGLDHITFTPMALPPVFDAGAGVLSFFPDNIYASMIAIKVDSYRNGSLIGSVMRETLSLSLAAAAIQDFKGTSVSIYPSIAERDLQVRGLEEFSYCIYDVQGSRQQFNSTTDGRIYIGDLENGFYFVRMVSEKGNYVFRFLKCE